MEQIIRDVGMVEPEAFLGICNDVEERLIDQYPDDETAIIEMVSTWLVKLGVVPEGNLRGFV